MVIPVNHIPGWAEQMKKEDQGGLRRNKIGKTEAKDAKGGWSKVNILLLTVVSESCAWSPHSVLYSYDILYLSVGVLSISVNILLRSFWFLSTGVEEHLRPPMLTHGCSLCESYGHSHDFWERCNFLYVLVCVGIYISSACVIFFFCYVGLYCLSSILYIDVTQHNMI